MNQHALDDAITRLNLPDSVPADPTASQILLPQGPADHHKGILVPATVPPPRPTLTTPGDFDEGYIEDYCKRINAFLSHPVTDITPARRSPNYVPKPSRRGNKGKAAKLFLDKTRPLQSSVEFTSTWQSRHVGIDKLILLGQTCITLECTHSDFRELARFASDFDENQLGRISLKEPLVLCKEMAGCVNELTEAITGYARDPKPVLTVPYLKYFNVVCARASDLTRMAAAILPAGTLDEDKGLLTYQDVLQLVLDPEHHDVALAELAGKRAAAACEYVRLQLYQLKGHPKLTLEEVADFLVPTI